MPEWGASAEPTAVPVSTRVESHGMLGVAAWRESSTQGGERKAAEVTAHAPIAASSTTALAPANGRAMKAMQETAVTPSIQGPMRARLARTRSSQNPVAASGGASTGWWGGG